MLPYFTILRCISLSYQQSFTLIDHLFLLIAHFYHLAFHNCCLDNYRITVVWLVLGLNQDSLNWIDYDLLSLIGEESTWG